MIQTAGSVSIVSMSALSTDGPRLISSREPRILSIL